MTETSQRNGHEGPVAKRKDAKTQKRRTVEHSLTAQDIQRKRSLWQLAT